MIVAPRTTNDPTPDLRDLTGDERLHVPGLPLTCFMCGRRILQKHDEASIESPMTGGIRLAAHDSCTEDPTWTGLRYQQACSAIVSGGKEPLFSPLEGVPAK